MRIDAVIAWDLSGGSEHNQLARRAVEFGAFASEAAIPLHRRSKRMRGIGLGKEAWGILAERRGSGECEHCGELKCLHGSAFRFACASTLHLPPRRRDETFLKI